MNALKSISRPVVVQPTRRDLCFDLPASRICDWNGHGAHVTQIVNTLSIMFPVGERFFIDSVRAYRDRITEPELQQAVTAFIGQEAMHGREHQVYNEALFAAIPATAGMERFVARLLGFFQKFTPKSWQLSGTIALEHFTAILGDRLLKDPRILEGSDPRFTALLTWHALEETEHKSVAFDVWERVMGRGPLAYLLRIFGLVVATLILLVVTTSFHLRILGAQGKLSDRKGWHRFNRVLFGEIGIVRKLARPWADYFRPSFHPWDHDNRRFLGQMEPLALQYTKSSREVLPV